MWTVCGERKQQMQRLGGNKYPGLTGKQKTSQGAQSRGKKTKNKIKQQAMQDELQRKPEWAIVRSLDFTLSHLGSHQWNLRKTVIGSEKMTLHGQRLYKPIE